MQIPIDLRLARHGVIVLLLGLLTGFVIGNFHNRSAGDAAHLVGLIGGFGIMALGLLWPRLDLAPSWSSAGAWITALSMYLNWLGVVLRGWLGSGPKATDPPLLGSPVFWDHASGWIISAGAMLSLLSTLIVLFGLRKLATSSAPAGAMSAPAFTQR